MTALPAGRELDRAVAEAMGWECVTTPKGVTAWIMPGDGQRLSMLPYFSSTAPGQHMALMWAYLTRDADMVSVEWRYTPDGGFYEGFLACEKVGDQQSQGATFDEALSRLVVAVAEARKEAGDA